MKSVLVLGAAGFIGSRLVEKLIEAKYQVIGIDGLLEGTGGSKKHLKYSLDRMIFLDRRIEKIDGVKDLVQSVDVVVDCMAWTSHLSAMSNPLHDLELNVKSHLSFLTQLPSKPPQKFIYLGSRGQYGNSVSDFINEDSPMIPEDIQGIHKVVAESYYRVYSKVKNLKVVSLRFPNCYGINQPLQESNLGLIGEFIKCILAGNTIDVYGVKRKRNILFVDDLVTIIIDFMNIDYRAFNAYNIGGKQISLVDLAKIIISIVGKGSFRIKDIPDDIKMIDVDNATFSDKRIYQILGHVHYTDIKESLQETIKYFMEEIN